ncbi:putative gpi ethanolamine phosphate transferase 1 protein [Phaeoacremonium minimum UCRPA7]|uniref:GPI ethanolamine phosphate transferase 1 n=1 Tax=Phaeoacremonium minimum (strain UCR-PA7) TaxID=1286976 RepID=R8BPZ1_PHAM7|nr:putative gpi ethanolamine phosphate transferase 1 protein [Phaeoacremonium minimum UCRPA7]EOO01453.1 putative gpi ethanolamine phosphate transferase 1 protein [Phaeoacremonium minimum UCRPA7]
MARFPRVRFMAIAMIFHLVYIYSIFDIYFVSPIVSGMRLFGVERSGTMRAPADRLVLFVGDGLRADKTFQSWPEPYPESEEDLKPRPLAPFLRSRVLEHGTFGVSHTRVPTESRPGHVALIAGLYEDVSAVTTGWKLNPVDFDSVFNRSRHTWSWGSPDILPMFEQGAVPGRVDAFMYSAELEDFSHDALQLDYWVFDHVKELFEEAQKNQTLNNALRQDKVVFFLHLLGLDTSGHSYRPYSKEYLNNIKVVDQGVKEITELINKFYADDRTAFVFTADHGMSDWGSHGDGHPDNTRTPLISWGSGVAKPEINKDTVAPGHSDYSSDWGLDHVRRHDVSQADVAALMAYLVGIDFPANSVGKLPLSYLSADIKEKAEAFLVNAQGILEIYRVKEEQKKASELRFRPYSPFSVETPEQRAADIQQLIQAGHFEEAIEETDALIQFGLQGLRYLQTYDWLFLRALITIGYLGWMAFAISTVVNLHVLHGKVEPSRSLAGLAIFSSIFVLLSASFIASKSPVTYYAYAFFPVFFWEEVYARRESLIQGSKILFGHVQSGGSFMTLFVNGALYIATIESLALGYIHRQILTVLFILGAFWPVLCGPSFIKEHVALSATWFVSCVSMSVFTLLDANKVESVNLVMIGGALMVTVGLVYLIYEDRILAGFSPVSKYQKSGLPMSRILVGVQLSHYSCLWRTGFNRTATIFIGSNGSAAEVHKSTETFRPLTLQDARIALFFFVLLQAAFFSTGNVASISSFSLESVCRLLPIFDPFSQGALLVLKLMIPFALVSANLGILNKRLGVAPSALFMVVMAISDILTLYFFWVVKDEGSWLEIGSTITHFAIASLLSVFVAALEGVSAMFISGVDVDSPLGKLITNGDAAEKKNPTPEANGLGSTN